MNDTNCAHCLALQAEVARLTQEQEKLRAALALADEAIASGQDVTSEAAFVQWRYRSQAMRPHGDLIAPAALASLPQQEK
jgi:hypothetical protein